MDNNNKSNSNAIIFEDDLVFCVSCEDEVLVDSCVIIPKAYKETPFDLSMNEWIATKKMIDKVKKYLDEKCHPDGYNLGWNVGKIAGQEVKHVHLHIIPRFSDEPFAGKGIHHWLKKQENKRNFLK